MDKQLWAISRGMLAVTVVAVMAMACGSEAADPNPSPAADPADGAKGIVVEGPKAQGDELSTVLND